MLAPEARPERDYEASVALAPTGVCTMLLTKAHVTVFKSIDDSGVVDIDSRVTVLVGQNESGKTTFLKALYKTDPIEPSVVFDVVEDYPRKSLSKYEPRHSTKPDRVVTLTYAANDSLITEINNSLGFSFFKELSFSIEKSYDGKRTIGLTVDQKPLVAHILSQSPLPKDSKEVLTKSQTLSQLIVAVEQLDLNEQGLEWKSNLTNKYPLEGSWDRFNWYLWTEWLSDYVPKFLYFDDYKLLPGKINLKLLSERVAASVKVPPDSKVLTDEDRTVLSLLQLAGVTVDDLMSPAGYEKSKARLEGISNSITDRVFEFWAQNQELEVAFDIKEDPKDRVPFNDGPNLYIRIKNQRHRVSVPFDQRSRGFIWFFSFLVWFDSVKRNIKTSRDLVLLLDEPGLSLHALAQADFLRYIDELSSSHQIIYTTHSPFMIHGDRLQQVRTVEDKIVGGTKISSHLSASDSKTLFPLQAALGYTISQNLFISKRNLLVEGPADLLYLKTFSVILDALQRDGLRDSITIVPAGGLDKLATFVALLNGNNLHFAVLHDYSSKPDPHLESLTREKLLQPKLILHYGLFRTATDKKKKAKEQDASLATDVEDLFEPDEYLSLFNEAFKNELGAQNIAVSDLPPGDRIIIRINDYLKTAGIAIRPSGGFNHYRVASHLASTAGSLTWSETTLARFERLFDRVNDLFQPDEDEETA